MAFTSPRTPCPQEELVVKLLLYSHFFAPSIGGVETVGDVSCQGIVPARQLPRPGRV